MPAMISASVEDALGIVIFVVVGLSAIGAVAAVVTSGKTYDQIGRGGLSIGDGDGTRRRDPAPGSAAATAEQREEILQMLEAKNQRLARRGEAQLDIEAELKRLTMPNIDAGLRAEIRDMVVARNARRERRGEAPLDIEAEVDRQIAELGGG